MGNGNGSPASRRQIGLMLRRLREDAHKSIADVVEAKVAGATKVWRIESGQTLPSIPDILGFCWVYEADPPTTKRLTDMVTEIANGGNGFWEEHGDSVPTWLSLYVGMEQTATDVQLFEPDLVHGLLQTRAYAVATNDEPQQSERNADLRLARQNAVFDRKDTYQMRVVLGAGALARQVGSPELMTDQLDHLRTLSRQPRLDIRILGWRVWMHAAVNGPFARFEFTSPGEDPVVYVPLLAGGRYFEKPDQIRPYENAFDRLWHHSTPVEEHAP